MKSKPSRSDIFVVGGGISGICAAITAAREGAIVKLVDPLENLGGKICEIYQMPMDLEGSCNDPFFRESGIFEEICYSLRCENKEGNYSGQARTLFSMISKEPNIMLMLGFHCVDLAHNSSKDRIESCTIVSHSQPLRYLHRAQYFIDCSISGELSKLANAPGEVHNPIDPHTANSVKALHKSSVLIEIESSQNESFFKCPEWVKYKWEDNSPSAKLALLQSLEKQLNGFHLIEWFGQDTSIPTSQELCWSAWDFIKNRSAFKETAQKLQIKRVITQPYYQDLFRGIGDYQLSKVDLIQGNEFYDSVAVARPPIIERNGQANNAVRKIALPHSFDIPLRSLYSQKIKNLFWAGSHISCDDVVSETLAHPPTQAQIGSAVGYCAARAILDNRLPRTLAKPGHIEKIRKDLQKKNHRTGRYFPFDDNDLATRGTFCASTTWNNKNYLELPTEKGKKTNSCLVQFPITTAQIDSVRLLVHGNANQNFEARLLQGSSQNLTIPGSCLQTDFYRLNKDGEQWIFFRLDTKIQKVGWHFLEIRSEQQFNLVEGRKAPVGHLIQYPKTSGNLTVENPYSDYFVPVVYEPLPHNCSILEIAPTQDPYSSENLKEVNSRPTHLPGLWISQPTTFSYPEFIELHWPSPFKTSRIELFFDPSFGYNTNPSPTPANLEVAVSIIRDYKIYLTLENGKTILAEEVSGNVSAHRVHEIENYTIQSLEIEILGTHGLNRAQIFRIAVYE